MRYIWETQDIIVGRKVQAHNRTENWIIGYDPSVHTTNRWALVSCVDGMICRQGMDIPEIVAFLNKSANRPMTIELNDHQGPQP